jgi:hypothetical protein
MTQSQARSPAVKRYMQRFLPAMGLYVLVLFASLFAIKILDPTGPLLWILAVAPAIPILAVIAIMGLYITEESDELPRAVMVQSMLWGIGLTLSAATVWGFLENADLVPHLSYFLIFPLFCAAMGLAQPFVWRRYR